MTGKASTGAKGEGAGAPKEGSDAFDQALIKWAPAAAGDPKISFAFALGWRVGDVAAWAATGEPPVDAEDFGFDAASRWTVLSGQIAAAQAELVPKPTLPIPAFDGAPPQAGETDVTPFRNALLAQLCIIDVQLGKAYQLGHGLQQFCANGHVTAAAIAELKKLLVSLATKFPPNAAHSVINSLTLWEDEIGSKSAADRLRRQGGVWRPVLAGEVAARDLLHLSDYVGTAEEVIGRLQEVTRRALRGRLLWLVVLILALVVAGVAVLALGNSSGGSVTAGAGSLLAAFGLTWKGVGTYLGSAAAKGEQALWDAQLNWTIAYRATVGKQSATETAREQAKRRKGHVKRWKSWQKDWPDIELDA